MKDHVEQVLARFEHLTQRLSDEAVHTDPNQYRKLAKERSDMEDVVAVAKHLRDVYKTIEDDQAVIAANEDPELVSMAKTEVGELQEKRGELEERFKFMLVPKDPSDSKNTIVEIRAGTGGRKRIFSSPI